MQERIETINNVSENHVFKTAENAVSTDYVLLRSDLDVDDDNYPDYYDVAHVTLVNSTDVVGTLAVDLLEIVWDKLQSKYRVNEDTEKADKIAQVMNNVEQAILLLNDIEGV